MTNESKKIDPENWLQPDPSFNNSAGFTFEECMVMAQQMMNLKPGTWDYQGPKAPIVTPQEWIKKVSRHRLNETVPSDLRALFYGAQAMLAYGCYSYQLCTLAVEQLLRVLEGALTSKCAELKGPGQKKPLQEKLKWLCDSGFITKEQWHGWDQMRTIRNGTSHPSFQMLMPPAIADHLFALLGADIESLFRQATKP